MWGLSFALATDMNSVTTDSKCVCEKSAVELRDI